MKKLFLAVSFLASFACFGATTPGAFESNDGIVSPSTARGMTTFWDFTHDTNGDMVVCSENHGSELTRKGCEGAGWKRIIDLIPKGTKYVGFRVAPALYGRRVLELYWK